MWPIILIVNLMQRLGLLWISKGVMSFSVSVLFVSVLSVSVRLALWGFVGISVFAIHMAQAAPPQVKIWSPYTQTSQTFLCLQADLEDWRFAKTEETGAPFVPHRLINLPEGKYIDQITAALDTGELPHFLLLEATQKMVLDQRSDLNEGPLFGADLIGLWVNESILATLPQATTALAGIWRGDSETALFALDDFLVLLDRQENLPLGIDVGPSGGDIGLSLALMIQQWTPALDTPDLPDWSHPELFSMLEIVNRWQQEGLMAEIDFAEQQRAGGDLPYLTFARYSTGRNLGPDYAFYPLFSGTAEKSTSFLQLPLHWYDLRPSDSGLSRDLLTEMSGGNIFQTCAETAGLLSLQQLINVGEQGSILQALNAGYASAVNPNVEISVSVWGGRSPDLPIKLTNLLRDIRAGLSISNALGVINSQ